MNILLDQTQRRKLICVKSQERVFYLEFPTNCDTAELYGVVTAFQSELWKALEKEKADKEKQQTELEPEIAPEVSE